MGSLLHLESKWGGEILRGDPAVLPLPDDRDLQLERFCRLAQQTLRAPAAIVTIGSDHRQWVKASQGREVADALPAEEPLPLEIFGRVVESDQPVELQFDAAACEGGAAIWIETGPAASLLATPLRDRDGGLLGTLSVLDARPRKWNAWQRDALTTIAAIVENHIDTDTKVAGMRAEQWRSDLVAREMSHRMRNVFTVVSGFVTISAKNHPGSAGLAQMILGRIEAFATANDYVVSKQSPLAAASDRAELAGLIEVLCRAYDSSGRISVEGGALPVNEKAALVISLVIHELGTNSLKYGSLSCPDGRVAIRCEEAGARFRIVWREYDGPSIDCPPTRIGFGSRMCQQAVAGSIDGKVTYDWRPDGLTVSIDAARAALIK
ncbi:hypothetical protein E3C22_21180 [Jiella endophytica]|uniref:histidine kinase n=1 Tax=Jiella endophytica TaxID=2558362 RepID=A0A4Y8RCP2_9HYPH|nr:GAF domain-containing protein [Jiella endophytica]TFF18739.1 hypothetical protein E3C22_21180 [Jiella endophytica]